MKLSTESFTYVTKRYSCLRVGILHLSLLFIFTLFSYSIFSQDSSNVSYPFRKGKIIIGLSGSISSGQGAVDTSGNTAFRNRYSIHFNSSYLVINQFAIGGLLSLSSVENNEAVKRATEVLFVGPTGTFYFTKGQDGSLFLQLALGYAKFQDYTEINTGTTPYSINTVGNGPSGQLSIGYAYVFKNIVSFDLSLGYNTSWLYAETKETGSVNKTTNSNLVISNLQFTFGFNILLNSKSKN